MSQPQIRVLYKAILRLHRSLPTELREMGDVYVKDEFRRHVKSSDSKDFLATFMAEWTNYYATLVKQLGQKGAAPTSFGRPLSDKLNELADQQVYQLYELKKAIESPEELKQRQEDEAKGRNENR